MTIKAHFDGRVIVPDEPLDLAAGQPLIVHFDAVDQAGTAAATARRLRHSELGRIWNSIGGGIDSPQLARILREKAQRRRCNPTGRA